MHVIILIILIVIILIINIILYNIIINKVEHVFIISPIITVIATALKDPNSQDFFIWRKSLDEFGKMVVVMIMRGVVVQALRKLVM